MPSALHSRLASVTRSLMDSMMRLMIWPCEARAQRAWRGVRRGWRGKVGLGQGGSGCGSRVCERAVNINPRGAGRERNVMTTEACIARAPTSRAHAGRRMGPHPTRNSTTSTVSYMCVGCQRRAPAPHPHPALCAPPRTHILDGRLEHSNGEREGGGGAGAKGCDGEGAGCEVGEWCCLSFPTVDVRTRRPRDSRWARGARGVGRADAARVCHQHECWGSA